jgi:hypothetical protein
MATRPELIEMCKELNIEYDNLSSNEMKEEIKKRSDKVFNKRYHVSADNISLTLKKFLNLEYDYKFFDRDGNEYDYKGRLK